LGKNSIGNITKVEIVSRDGSSQSRSTGEIEKDLLEVKAFVDRYQGNSVFVFTDGSVYGGLVGCGACAAVINPLNNAELQITAAEAVGTKVDSTTLRTLWHRSWITNCYTIGRYRGPVGVTIRGRLACETFQHLPVRPARWTVRTRGKLVATTQARCVSAGEL